jgi:hypothetical protein
MASAGAGAGGAGAGAGGAGGNAATTNRPTLAIPNENNYTGPVGMTVRPGGRRSVMSVASHGFNSIEHGFEHPITRFFHPGEAASLREVHSEFEWGAGVTRFDDLNTLVTDFRRWRAANPSAISLRLDGDANLADFAAFAAGPELRTGFGGGPGLLKLKVEQPAQAHAPHGVVPATYGASLAAAVRGISTLQELHLPFAGLGDLHGATLAAALTPSLTFLDLAHNQLGPAGAAALAAALPGLPQLTTLRLSGNPFETAGVVALAPALPATLRVLELGCRMGDAGAAALGPFLPRLRALTHVDFSNNGLTDAGLRDLLPNLPETLRELQLDGNPFGPAGAEAIAAAFPRLRGVQLLSLKACALRDAGMQDLAPALRALPELTELRLQYNDINADGARALVAVLPNLPKFRRLGFLGGNEGALGIVEAMQAALPGKTISMRREDGEFDVDGTLAIRNKGRRSSGRSLRRRSTRRNYRRSSRRSRK